MDVAVGGDLTVASVQDTGRIDGSSSGFSAGLSYSLGGGDWGDSGGETGAQDSESGDEDASAEADRRGSYNDPILDTIARLPTVEGGYEARERDQITRATVAAPNGNATHKHEKVRAWLAKRPRFHMHFTPTSSSWLNLVERFFADFTGDVIRAGSSASVKELVADIKPYLTQRNAEPRPYKWKAEGAAILEKIQRARAALDSAEAAK